MEKESMDIIIQVTQLLLFSLVLPFINGYLRKLKENAAENSIQKQALNVEAIMNILTLVAKQGVKFGSEYAYKRWKDNNTKEATPDEIKREATNHSMEILKSIINENPIPGLKDFVDEGKLSKMIESELADMRQELDIKYSMAKTKVIKEKGLPENATMPSFYTEWDH